MSKSHPHLPTSAQIVQALHKFIQSAVKANGGRTDAVRPEHRVPFHWPPDAISYRFHVLASDWKGHATYRAHGEEFPVRVAQTEHGVFGRCEKLWHEAKGATERDMLEALAAGAEPLLLRQFAISRTLGVERRFVGYMRDLAPEDLVKLLYCEDRDVGHEARVEIEKHASLQIFGPALVEALRDTCHPMRRSAQWQILDIFEDLPSVCRSHEDQLAAIAAMKELVWDAQDDYARTVYKAGVVLGGHVPDERGGEVLIECLSAPSKIGRRSAIHGLFHIVEWRPATMDLVVSALRRVGQEDPEPILRDYASDMADDIEAGRDHIKEPVFPEEAA